VSVSITLGLLGLALFAAILVLIAALGVIDLTADRTEPNGDTEPETKAS
jgi:hypothetical protein